LALILKGGRLKNRRRQPEKLPTPGTHNNVRRKKALMETTDGRIRLVRIITDPPAIRAVASLAGLRDLVSQAHKDIHLWADEQPDTNHLATRRETYANGRKGFCVGMVYTVNGFFIDFGLLFEFESDVSWEEAQLAMIDSAERCAPFLIEKGLRGTKCACCEKEVA
jgi:hypothetical protein